MTQYKHILLAADLVPSDDNPVADKALQLAKEHGAQLSMIHVIEHPSTYGPASMVPTVLEWEQEVEEKAKQEFSALADKLGIPMDRCHLMSGQAKSQILDMADKVHADLIVMGRHGRHGIDLLLLGSTANGVVHNAKCDVLTVKVKE